MYLQPLGQLSCQPSVDKDLAHVSVKEKGIGDTPQGGPANIRCLPVHSILCNRSDALSNILDLYSNEIIVHHTSLQ